MSTTDLRKRLAELKGALALMEADLAGKDVGQDELRELRNVVDNARQSVWTVMQAAISDDYHTFVTGFRLRRAVNLYRAVLDDMTVGRLTIDMPELGSLRDALEDVLGMIPAVMTPAGSGGRNDG